MNAPPVRARHGLFILLRRLRKPLLLLICMYAVCVLGFVLIPGRTPGGEPWQMSFLHAFYFVSFLGTTIGLGEVPYPFTDAQRLWATVSIYGTVVAWLYAVGALFSVLRDPTFRHLTHASGVEREVRRFREPFYLLCGYDDTGWRVVHELSQDAVRVVVVDKEPARVDGVDVDDHEVEVPALIGDASDSKALTTAGLMSPYCAGVLALTGSDATNSKIAITARLLNPQTPVICVARDHGWHPRMAAAGADHIINPFDTFAERLALTIRTPSLHVIYEALTTQLGTAAAEVPELPRGKWVLCGYGQFARTLRRQLLALDIQVVVVDTELDDSCDADNSVRGDPTDPAILRKAGVETAQAVIAGTTVDIDNLAIALAVRALNKDLFLVARQTHRRNSAVFRASPADLVMVSSYVVAAEVLRDLRAPMLSSFLRRARDEDETWASTLLGQLRATVGSEVLESWTMNITAKTLPAVCAALARGEPVTLRRLLTRVDGTQIAMRALPLMLQRGNTRHLSPALDETLQLDDQVLFCGRALARNRMRGMALTRALAPLSAAAPQESPHAAEQAEQAPEAHS